MNTDDTARAKPCRLLQTLTSKNLVVAALIAISRAKGWPKINKRIRAEKTLAQRSAIGEEKIGSIKLKKKMRDLPIQTLTPSCRSYSKSENILAESRTGYSPLVPMSKYTISKIGKNPNPELGKNSIPEIGKKSIFRNRKKFRFRNRKKLKF